RTPHGSPSPSSPCSWPGSSPRGRGERDPPVARGEAGLAGRGRRRRPRARGREGLGPGPLEAGGAARARGLRGPGGGCPSLDRGAMSVESHAGRGEALVSGAVTPRRYVIDRAQGTARSDPSAVVAGGALAPGELDAVLRLAREAEALFAVPQDVEWAIGEEG